jgi:hypothetical protein
MNDLVIEVEGLRSTSILVTSAALATRICTQMSK